ncbi:MAG TPA: hypothetical protein VFB79_09170 [Candidatus Angelobacter sp.]|nr:hypothetical protein [Candidatus Angelobacter sp.]
MLTNDIPNQDIRLGRLRSRYPGKSDDELMTLMRFLDRYVEIALSIYLEATEPITPDEP